MRKPILMLCTILTAGLFMTNCSKDGVPDPNDDNTENVNSATDYSSAESAFEDVYDIIDEEAQQQGDLNGFTNEDQAEDRDGCAEVTITRTLPEIFPVTMVLNFGDEKCTMPNGREVSGTITTVYTGRIRQPGTTISVTFDNFTLNGNIINGTKTITNNGLNNDSQLSFTFTVENGSVVFTDGTSVEYETSRTRTWVEGMDTKFQTDGIEGVRDDVWEITGNASGINRKGNAYEVNITTPLRRQMNCRWLTSGVLEVDTNRFDTTAIINYGDGACDNKAVVRVGEHEKEITLR